MKMIKSARLFKGSQQIIKIISIAVFVLSICPVSAKQTFQSKAYSFSANTLIDDLNHPWAVEWLDSSDQSSSSLLLVTERNGAIVAYKKYIHSYQLTIPDRTFQRGQGGLLDIKKHPNYSENGWIYLTYSAYAENKSTTRLARFKIKKQQIDQWQILFTVKPWSSRSQHFGSRIAFDQDDYVYITVGDRGERELAQSLKHHNGSVIRLHSDGRVPKDNPFPQIRALYSYGHRNPQGLWYDKSNNRLWAHEHGPRGGDELNIIEKGKNYGWPTIGYGNEYWNNLPVSDNTHKEGMEQPVHYWTPSIAPSGLIRYSGNEFSKWDGDFFLGSLKFGELVRVRVAQTGTKFKVLEEERLLDGDLGRIRAVYQHNDQLFVLIDSSSGKLIRLRR